MRNLALLTTCFGILLHTLLGWCPHQHGYVEHVALRSKASPQDHHCHRHAADDEHVPADSEAHHSDHAGCFFVSQIESVQGLAAAILCEYAPLQLPEPIRAVQRMAERDQANRLFLPHAQGQAARIVRGVWLI